jgi:hypothetical protein
MRCACRILCVLGLLVATAGCQSTERERLEEERRSLEFQRSHLRGTLNGSAPIGSRWDSHPDTHQFTNELNRISARINEIDRKLMEP